MHSNTELETRTFAELPRPHAERTHPLSPPLTRAAPRLWLSTLQCLVIVTLSPSYSLGVPLSVPPSVGLDEWTTTYTLLPSQRTEYFQGPENVPRPAWPSSPTPTPAPATAGFSSLAVASPFPECRILGATQRAALSSGPPPLWRTQSRSRRVLRGPAVGLAWAGIHSPSEGRLGCFPVLVIIDTYTINTRLQVFGGNVYFQFIGANTEDYSG